MGDKTIKLKIISPERIVCEDEVDEIITDGTCGKFGILPDHVPFMSSVAIGVTKVIQDGKEEFISTMGGTFQINNNEAILLTNGAELSGEIDVLRAQAAKERAEALLGSKAAELDAARAKMAIAKAMARLKAANRQH